MQACSCFGGRARLEEIFRGSAGKSKVTQGHLEPNAAEGISGERGPENECRANRIWKAGRERIVSQRVLETATSNWLFLFALSERFPVR